MAACLWFLPGRAMPVEPSSRADPPPVPPEPPLPSDCCGGGCERCVYELYDQALERYQAELTQWRERHPQP